MRIQTFKSHHINDVKALLEDCSPYVLPHHPYIYWIMSEYFSSLCFVALEKDTVIGFVCALHSVEKNSIFIWQLAVKNEHKREGIAGLLCEKIVAYAFKYNISSLQATINDNNAASLSFFLQFSKKHGKSFEKILSQGLNRFENESAYIICL